MKTLLLNPPIPVNQGRDIPLGIAYIAAILEKHGKDVAVLDAMVLDFDEEAAFNEIAMISPDIIGITTPTTVDKSVFSLTHRLKKHKPSMFIVLGGISPTVSPDYCVENSSADAVVKGEGEFVMLELVKKLEAGDDWRDIDGLSYRQNDSVHHNRRAPFIEDLDSLPFPARHLFPSERYGRREFSDPMGRLITGRGCMASCIYCTAPIMHGKHIRSRSADSIVDEIQYLMKTYGVKNFVFEDDTFTAKPELVKSICNEIISRGIKAGFWCQTRVPNVTTEMLSLMKKAGFIQISFGIESGDDSVLRTIKKGINISLVEKAVEAAKKAGMPYSVNFMIGNIGESRESVKRSVELAKKLDPFQVIFSIAIPFPGTEFRKICEDNGWLLEADTNTYHIQTKPVSRTKDLTADEIKQLYKKAYRDFYFRPKVIFRFIRESVKPRNFHIYLGYLKRWFNYTFRWDK